MSDETLERDVLSHVTSDRREFIKRYVVGAAFAAPVIASFAMANPAGAHAHTFTPNVGNPPPPTTKAQCMNGGWKTWPQFKNQGACIRFVNTGK